MRSPTLNEPSSSLDRESAVAVLARDLAREPLRLAAVSRLDAVAHAERAVVLAVEAALLLAASAAALLADQIRAHAQLAVAVVVLDREGAVAVLARDLTTVPLRLAAVSRLDAVAHAERAVVLAVEAALLLAASAAALLADQIRAHAQLAVAVVVLDREGAVAVL